MNTHPVPARCNDLPRSLSKHPWPPTETTLIYVGNGNGDIVAAHLSPTELAELSGDAKGPVPSQRRPNHNPYRAVRVELTPQVARLSLQAACHAQKQAAAGGNGEAGVAGGVHANMPRCTYIRNASAQKIKSQTVARHKSVCLVNCKQACFAFDQAAMIYTG